jgi:hypothetical protein
MTAQVEAVTARWRAPYLRSMLDLQVGDSVDLRPDEGDTLKALWGRVKKQSARYRPAGYHFHLHKRTDYIFVQRVESEQRRKLAPFFRLRVGDKMRCTEPFETEQQQRNLRRKLLYLWDEKGYFIWVEQHSDGRLYYRCIDRRDNRVALWYERPSDDGSISRGARLVCCPSELKCFQAEFERAKAAILASRAAAAADITCAISE